MEPRLFPIARNLHPQKTPKISALFYNNSKKILGKFRVSDKLLKEKRFSDFLACLALLNARALRC